MKNFADTVSENPLRIVGRRIRTPQLHVVCTMRGLWLLFPGACAFHAARCAAPRVRLASADDSASVSADSDVDEDRAIAVQRDWRAYDDAREKDRYSSSDTEGSCHPADPDQSEQSDQQTRPLVIRWAESVRPGLRCHSLRFFFSDFLRLLQNSETATT